MKKRYKILITFFLLLVSIPLMLYGILRSSSMQTWLAQKFASYFSEEYNTDVTIQGVDIKLFNTIVLEKFYIEDLNEDTLLYVDAFDVDISDFKYSENKVLIEDIALNNPTIKVKSDTAGVMNFQYVLDAFLSDEQDTTSSAPWDLKVKYIKIKNANLQYYDAVADTLSDTIPQRAVNFSDLKFKNTNLIVRNIVLGDTISLDIEGFDTKEQSGFLIQKIASGVKYYDTGIELKDLQIQLEKTNILSNYLNISYDSLADFSDFINKVKLEVDLDKNTQIYTSDLAYLSESLAGYNLNFGIGAFISGYVNDLKVDSLDFKFAENTRLKTDFTVKGLPNVYKTDFDVNIRKLSTSKTDLSTIKMPPFDKNSQLPIPKEVGLLGLMNFSGNFKGNISHFDHTGSLTTSLGSITTKAAIDYDTLTTRIKFDTDLTGSDLVVNKLLGDTTHYGNIDFSAKLKGENLGNTVDADVETLISNFVYNGYKYSELELLGRITEKSFNGKVTLIDPNVLLDLNGDFYFTEDSSSYLFNGSLQQAHLETLNIDTVRKEGVLSLLFEGNLSGNSADNINGTASVLNLDYISTSDTVTLEEIKLTAKNDPEKNIHKLSLESPIVDFSTNGDYVVSDLTYSLQELFSRYLPSVIDIPEKEKDRIITDSKVSFDINVKETSDLFKLFVPGLHLAEGTNFKGSYNSKASSFTLNGYSPFIAYGDQKLSEISINTNTSSDELSTTIVSEKLFFTKENSLDYFILSNKLRNDSIELDMEWDNNDSIQYSGKISTISKISKNDSTKSSIIETFINPSHVVLADTLWKISKSSVFIDTTLINIHKLNIYNGRQNLGIDGSISTDKNDSLTIRFGKFQLNNLDLLTQESGIYTSGELNGAVKISGIYDSPYIYSETNIDSFVVNNEYIGDVDLLGNTFQEKVFVDVQANRLALKTLTLNGNYNLKTDSLDFNLMLNKFRLKSLSPYVQGIISNLNGRLDSHLKIGGTTEKPELNGVLAFHKCIFTLDYTKAQYNFTDSIIITEDKFKFNSMQIFSGRKNRAFLSGEITHNYFSDFAFDLTIDSKNFLFLNTKAGDNDLFYGTAYASGLIGIKGPLEKIVVDVNVTPRPRTHLYLPLSSASEVSENDFITFVNVVDTLNTENEEPKIVDLNGIQMNIAIDMTPDAIIEMIFDETVGDKMIAQGSGPMRMEINTLGDFNMYGEYKISKGSYLFTLQNLINKYFEVKPGSTLKWNGSPYDALLDLTAVYKIKKVPLYDLVLEDEFKETKIPVDCNLSMKGNLTAPTIKFDIGLKNADDKIETQVNSLTEDDLNKQVLSLLIINKFQPLPGLGSDIISASGVGVNTTELLSNQLSNWLSQISNDFDIGINYRPGSDISSQEVEVALSTQLWNDRISINGNVGVEGQSTSSSSQSGSNVVGDFDIEFKVTKNGKFRVRAFTRANNNTVYEMAPYTHGAGVFYREDFNSISELLTRYKTAIFKGEKKKKEENNNVPNNKEAVKEED